MGAPSEARQKRIVPCSGWGATSSLPEIRLKPLGENATEVTEGLGTLAGRASARLRAPVATCQTLTVPSRLPAATREPSGVKATDITWPANAGVSVRMNVPLDTCQSCTLPTPPKASTCP